MDYGLGQDASSDAEGLADACRIHAPSVAQIPGKRRAGKTSGVCGDGSVAVLLVHGKRDGPLWRARHGEDGVNQNLRNLIQLLGEAIHETVSESEHIARVVRDIRNQGFDVLLMLEATIGLNEVDPATVEADASEQTDLQLVPFTPHDLNFLKSLRISLTGDSAASAQGEDDAPEKPQS
jgi:hypothetical protein